MRLVDTHVHINFEAFQADLDEVAAAWRQAGVVSLIHSCVKPDEFEGMRAIADRYPEVFLAVGLHPLDMDKWMPETATQIRTYAESDSRVVAIGETGLDFYKANDGDLQRIAFWAQMQIAHDLQLPIIVHCREAAAETVALIRQFQAAQGELNGVMHCWAGSPEETQWFLDVGFYISFSGIVTFKNAHVIKASARMVPLDRLLVETDCPFLTPEPRRKERRNQPAHVAHVAACLADLRQHPLAELAELTTQNAIRLFRLPSLPPVGKPESSALGSLDLVAL